MRLVQPRLDAFVWIHNLCVGLNAAQAGAWAIQSNVDNQLEAYISRYYESFISALPADRDPWKVRQTGCASAPTEEYGSW
jgi:hypothetical protein